MHRLQQNEKSTFVNEDTPVCEFVSLVDIISWAEDYMALSPQTRKFYRTTFGGRELTKALCPIITAFSFAL